ncbi:3'(2'),5'-bisphosphate nucleotidase CysQ family protein [Aquirufa aurantiipilula]|uniref:3'(2'),5'-bisphosphate nucleotidase CysQ family protein n=1 Tax=Aquirufa aurantiipilula TaxID=2696561 RepID=UPI001CAA78F2|nr:3'(2'),5'-bisphosphate nucleotidase CysQ [Aquirufa aurantiipilula]MBZ1326588.1 3'(2'),5'-bisphosphate nucleotidase CysQ [Aquirufa aurantiipilula]
MNELDKKSLIKLAYLAIDAAKLAGNLILEHYKKDIEIKIKKDGSPLTIADRSSNQSIVKSLSKTNFPIVSEEERELPFESRYYWLVDPLDGTKDFLDFNDEFTINIALVDFDTPIIGIIYAPGLDELYVGILGKKAWAIIRGIKKTVKLLPKRKTLKMAISRFHNHADANNFALENEISQCEAIGSSLKYGRLIFGHVDVYPRLVGTSEWDTAAGQVIMESGGGKLLDWNTKEPLRYNKINRRNGRFIAFRSPYVISDFKLQQFKTELI